MIAKTGGSPCRKGRRTGDTNASNSLPQKGVNGPPLSYADEQAKVTMEKICFNYTRTAAGATYSPRFLRTMTKTVDKGNLQAVRKQYKGVWASLHTVGLAAGPGKRRVKRTLRR